MGIAPAVTRVDHTASELRAFAAKSGDGAQVRRLLAIALVLEGYSRTEAAQLSGMDRQTLRDWVHRSNDEGIDGFIHLQDLDKRVAQIHPQSAPPNAGTQQRSASCPSNMAASLASTTRQSV